jgi:hypothetical protein
MRSNSPKKGDLGMGEMLIQTVLYHLVIKSSIINRGPTAGSLIVEENSTDWNSYQLIEPILEKPSEPGSGHSGTGVNFDDHPNPN